MPFDSGSPIIDYQLEIYENSAWTVLTSDLTALTYTYPNTVQGDTYTFRMKSRNAYGTSEYSEAKTITSGKIPDSIGMPTALVTGADLTITWTETANSNGSPVTYYRILFRTSDGVTYDEEKLGCDGSNADIMTALSCTFPLSNLLLSPLNLVAGDPLWIKVRVGNGHGDSEDSPINNSQTMVTLPSTPVLSNDFTTTTLYNLALVWAIETDGAAPILAHTLWYAEDGSSDFILIADDLLTNSYITQPELGLEASKKYQF